PTTSAVWYAVQFTPDGVVRMNNPGYIVENSTMGASNGPQGHNIMAGVTCKAVPCNVSYGYESGLGPPTSGGTMTLFGLAGSNHTSAADVSDDGTRIVGGSTTATGTHAVMWNLGSTAQGYPSWSLQDLGAPGTQDGSTPSAFATGINPAGSVVI